ncbi:hypothetical protein TNCV_4761671 [Trichonephila clavipes]|uniref:Pre-C2HC domain-containing protein n=1 Tax=Trichonephila clavipes TaxID=2585209 RepID=A0A8X6V3J7_TRICX|nr:hypothetical protein TNCV_4761671 [Trichonephila clavipes]
MPSDMPPQQITEGLLELGITVSECHVMINRKTGLPMPLFLLSLPKDVYNISEVCFMKIKVEPLEKKKGPAQCFRCQGFSTARGFAPGTTSATTTQQTSRLSENPLNKPPPPPPKVNFWDERTRKRKEAMEAEKQKSQASTSAPAPPVENSPKPQPTTSQSVATIPQPQSKTTPQPSTSSTSQESLLLSTLK